ncbi:MAG TPA: acyl-CoA dehydrogenase family protein [Xanthobacteraceae bacterium]|nr:acyl-CoA dehydrogenase family protein [Xanthobacteraceae bacterium]
MNAYNSQRVGAGTVAMGIAAGALELATDWVKEREQFGRPNCSRSWTQSVASSSAPAAMPIATVPAPTRCEL